MSTDLPIGVKVDTGDSAAKAKAVEDALHKTEDAGIAAGKAMDGLTGASRKASDALERERTSLQRTTQLHDQLTTKSSALVRSTESLAEAIRREQAMLDRIHGPARQYAQDLQVLDSLLDRNKISTAEYAEQVARLNREIEKTPTKGQASAPSTGERLGAVGALLPIAGPPAAVGTVLSIGRSMEEIHHEAEALEDRYTNLTNVALKFANDGRTVNAALDMQRQLASELRAELAPTMDLYDGIGDAVRNYGFTTKEQIALTTLLGKEMIISNKPVSEAAGLMQRLAVSLELGVGAGRQFKTIMAEYPELADAAAAGFHTDLAGLVKLVDEGKVKLPELTRAWLEHGGAITEEHSKRKKTHAEVRKEVIEDAEIAMNRGVPAMMAYSKELVEFDARMREVRAGGKPMADVLGNITAEVAEQARKWKVTEEAAKAAVGQDLLRQMRAIADVAGDVTSGITGIADALMSDGFYAVVKLADPWFVKPETPKKVAATRTEVSAYSQLLSELEGPEKKAIERYNLLGQLYMNGAISLERYGAELRKVKSQLVELGAIEVPSVAGALGAPTDPTAGIDTASLVDNRVVMWKDTPAGKTAAWHDETEKAKQSTEELLRTVEPLGEAFGKAFRGGDDAAKGLLDTLTQVGFKLLELGAISAFGPAGGIGAGFLKGLLGGKHGFDHVISGRSSVELPGFATGGDAMIGGPYRGTDKTLVAFWGTAGESLHVRTPEQRGAGGMGGPPQVIVRPIFQMPDMGKQIAEYFDGYGGEVAVREVQRRSRRSRRT